MRQKHLPLFLLTTFIFITGPNLLFAEGFEHGRFKQGMSINEALSVANSLGGYLRLDKSTDTPDALLKRYSFFMINDDHEYRSALEFCNNKKGLFSISHIVNDGFLKYVKVIENLRSKGFKIIETQTQMLIDQATNEHAMIFITLKKPLDKWTVAINLFGNDKHDTSHFQIRYAADHKKFCK
ncbi:MAG: hypothetical protein F3745_00820 [Nitrospinae bacterium]|nr:hypothetical protein [Nitrospinota bacterium]